MENGKVKDAWSSGQMFRGIEMMLKGRDPRDAQHFTQRACGVCTYVHALASVRAVEDACNIEIPENARLVRNLLSGVQMQHDHIVHFYHLHALDWVDIVSALKADPVKTAKLSANVSGKPETADYFKAAKTKLQTFVASGQLGPFNNGYWGHPTYQLPAEANLMAASHYLEALKLQAQTARMHAIFGGKNPHPQSLVVGGVTSVMDLNPARITEFETIWEKTKEFVEKVYIPDLVAVASFYKNWGAIGGNNDDKYSWIKAPRYAGLAPEVGPLARVLVAYARKDKAVQDLVNGTLKKLNVGTKALFSTLGRTAARGLETVVIGKEMGVWIDQLRSNIAKGNKKTYQKYEMPDKAQGYGLSGVPRGALGHWIKIKDKKIENYQMVVPSTWNLGPTDGKGNKGPVERSLIGTPIADPKRPLEVLRTVHSYDPCIACAIHVIDPKSNETYKVRVI